MIFSVQGRWVGRGSEGGNNNKSHWGKVQEQTHAGRLVIFFLFIYHLKLNLYLNVQDEAKSILIDTLGFGYQCTQTENMAIISFHSPNLGQKCLKFQKEAK